MNHRQNLFRVETAVVFRHHTDRVALLSHSGLKPTQSLERQHRFLAGYSSNVYFVPKASIK